MPLADWRRIQERKLAGMVTLEAANQAKSVASVTSTLMNAFMKMKCAEPVRGIKWMDFGKRDTYEKFLYLL